MAELSQGFVSLTSLGVIGRAVLYKIERTDGVTFRFTDHDEDIDFIETTGSAAQTYTAALVQESAVETNSDASENDFEAYGAIDADEITEEDLYAGLYREAQVTRYVVDPRAPFLGSLETRVFWITETEYANGPWQANLSSIITWFRAKVGHTYSRSCRWQLGVRDPDTLIGCQYTLTAIPTTAVVGGAVDSPLQANEVVLPINLTTQPLTAWDSGYVEFTGGDNAGVRLDIQQSIAESFSGALSGDSRLNRLQLQGRIPFDVAASDPLNAYIGCNGTLTRCSELGQLASHGGFHSIPGGDKAFQAPDRSEA